MIDRHAILDMMRSILVRQGKSGSLAEEAELQDVGFRSLDFSELALRVEMSTGKQLVFDAGPLRTIRTVRDVVDFMELSARGGN